MPFTPPAVPLTAVFTAVKPGETRTGKASTVSSGVVTVRPTSTGARIDVRDNGIGIAQRHHERIFERFYRVDEARSRRVGGTGLGLAIVKHYALASGCTVTLDSKEGQGTTFSVHVPR